MILHKFSTTPSQSTLAVSSSNNETSNFFPDYFIKLHKGSTIYQCHHNYNYYYYHGNANYCSTLKNFVHFDKCRFCDDDYKDSNQDENTFTGSKYINGNKLKSEYPWSWMFQRKDDAHENGYVEFLIKIPKILIAEALQICNVHGPRPIPSVICQFFQYNPTIKDLKDFIKTQIERTVFNYNDIQFADIVDVSFCFNSAFGVGYGINQLHYKWKQRQEQLKNENTKILDLTRVFDIPHDQFTRIPKFLQIDEFGYRFQYKIKDEFMYKYKDNTVTKPTDNSINIIMDDKKKDKQLQSPTVPLLLESKEDADRSRQLLRNGVNLSQERFYRKQVNGLGAFVYDTRKDPCQNAVHGLLSKKWVSIEYNLFVKSGKELLISLLNEIKENKMDPQLFEYDSLSNKLCLKQEITQQLNNLIQHKRHASMGYPLNIAEMFSLLLYSHGYDCGYDLCYQQRSGNYDKWIVFDFLLYFAISKLSEFENHGNMVLYSGMSGVTFKFNTSNKNPKILMLTYHSFSTKKAVAKAFRGKDGMLIAYKQATTDDDQSAYRDSGDSVGCDVTWISKFPGESEVLFRRHVLCGVRLIKETAKFQLIRMGNIHSKLEFEDLFDTSDLK